MQHDLSLAGRRSGEHVRSMGAHERLLYLYSKLHHRHFCMVGEISGSFAEDNLQDAFDRAQDRHPQLWLAVQDGETGPRFITHMRRIPLQIETSDSSQGWKSIVEKQLATPFNPWIGPLVRAIVLKEKAGIGRWTVILTFHHAIADGLSAVAFLKDIVAALNGVRLHKAQQRDSIEELVGKEMMVTDAMAGVPLPNVDLATIKAIASRPLWRAFDSDNPKVCSLDFPGELTTYLINEIRYKGVTFQSALCAAIAIANCRDVSSTSYSVLSPINIRSMAKVDTTEIGLFIAAASLKIDAVNEIPFWSLARRYKEWLSSSRSPKSLIGSLQLVESALPQTANAEIACGLVGAVAYDASVSNLGVVDVLSAGSKARLESLWGPMVLGRIRNERMFGAVTYAGHLRLTETRPAHIPESLPRVVEILEKACSTSTGGADA
ncbi:condensation domain-containing protein [Oryzifoliimicrobium ureilyticus]|uniref:condensation domain-containing protein n=1 Tax=Oryzifoliimicrobium ureilyticus TaxID=3113724 RepID=UPI0030764FD7